MFGTPGKSKVFFIGLDAGNDGNGEREADKWQLSVLSHYRGCQAPWNPHYKACIAIAADIHGLSCKTACKAKCAGGPTDACALAYFAQANGVRCVSPGKRDRSFTQRHLIPSCIYIAVQEITSKKPDVVILQSPALENPFYGLMRQLGTFSEETDYSAVFTFADGAAKMTVITTHHPASWWRGKRFSSFDAYLEEHVRPRIQIALKWLGRF